MDIKRKKNSKMRPAGVAMTIKLVIYESENKVKKQDLNLTESDLVAPFKDIIAPCLENDLHTYLYFFDQINLEKEATPLGVGMMSNDVISVISVMLMNTKLSDNHSLHRKRVNKGISFGLNVTIPGEVPIINKNFTHEHLDDESAAVCQSQLTCIKTVLFKALDMTIETYTDNLPEHRPDFSKIKDKLENGEYEHAQDCMSDVYEMMVRYENSGHILMSSKESEKEGSNRVRLKKDLWKTIKEFQQAINSYNGEDIDEVYIDEYFRKDGPNIDREEALLVFGPERNFTAVETQNSEPSIFMTGFNKWSTFDDVFFSYKFYCGLEVDECFDFVSNPADDCGKYHLPDPYFQAEPVLRFQKLNGLPQRFHLAMTRKNLTTISHGVEQMDLDALVEFIEGDPEEKISKKKSKKKKRRSNQEGSEDLTESVAPLEHHQSLPEIVQAPSPEPGSQPPTCSVSPTQTDRTAEDVQVSGQGGWTVTKKKNKKGSHPVKQLNQSVTSQSNNLVTSQAHDLVMSQSSSLSCEVRSVDLSTKPKENCKDRDVSGDSSNLSNSNLESSCNGESRPPTSNSNQLQCRLKELELEMEKNETVALDIMKESHGRLNKVQKSIETCEERRHDNGKKVAKIDTEVKSINSSIQELRLKLKDLEKSKNSVLKDTEAASKEMEKLTRQRIVLETEVDNKMAPIKRCKAEIAKEIEKLKEEMINISVAASKPEQKLGKEEVCDSNPRSDQLLLDFLASQIKAKETDLECPVCLETSHTPIYMCSEQHIICANCLRKVMSSRSECVECRTPYPTEPRRHRYMEKVADELQDLRNKRREIIHSSSFNKA